MSQCQIVSCDILLEFLEVAFHGVIYIKNLYPKEIFVKKKNYGTAVYMSEHPEINEYIRNVLESVKQMIVNDDQSVKTINLIFHNSDKLLVEKFVFNLKHFHVDTEKEDPYFFKVEESMRTLYLKLSMTTAYLKPLPEGSSFSIEVVTHEASHIALNGNSKCEDFPWIIKEPPTEIHSNYLLPLTNIKTEYLGLQAFVISYHEQ